MYAQFAAILQNLAALIQTLQATLQDWIDHGTAPLPEPPAPGPVDHPTLPDAPAEVSGHLVVAGTGGDDHLQGHAGLADLFLVTAGTDTIEGFEQGLDRIWMRDPATIDGHAVSAIITEKPDADGGTVYGTPATWLPDGADGARTGVALDLDGGALEVHGMTILDAGDWVFGAEVPAARVIEPVPADDWALV